MQTNGLTERFNQKLSRCLAKVCNEDQSNRDEMILAVLMEYTCFQQHMQLPIDGEVSWSEEILGEGCGMDLGAAINALLKWN